MARIESFTAWTSATVPPPIVRELSVWRARVCQRDRLAYSIAAKITRLQAWLLPTSLLTILLKSF